MPIKEVNNVEKSRLKIKKITYLAMLFAIAVVLMAIEAIIPPIPTLPPGVKLGLSNIVIMYCIFFLDVKSAFVILFLKTIFVFLTRGFTAFLLSFSGGLCSIVVIVLLLQLKNRNLSYIIISIFASITHNVAQLIVSGILLQSKMVVYYAPILMLSGIVMGIITGVLLKVVIPAMKRIQIKK